MYPGGMRTKDLSRNEVCFPKSIHKNVNKQCRKGERQNVQDQSKVQRIVTCSEIIKYQTRASQNLIGQIFSSLKGTLVWP